MAALRLRGVCKRFGGVDVVRGIDLDVADGEFLVLVGPSGCGKSTLLRMLAGLETISDGELQIGGRRANELRPADRGTAMVFQSYALYPNMTVAENMGFALKMAGMDRTAREARVLEVARTLQLEPLLQRLPGELSGGQRQRVAIGRAIVREPAVFLFDEPLSNLDAALRGSMRVELARLHQRLGATMVYVTHDQVEAMTLGQRVAVLRDGRLEQVGAPLALYQAPVNTFVAGFLGTPRINFIPRPEARASASHQSLWLHALPPMAATGAHQIGLRPEHLQLTCAEEGAPLRLVLAEHLGDTVVLHLQLEGVESLLHAKVAPPSFLPEPGSIVHVRSVPGHALAFDAQGLRLSTAATP